MKSKIIFILWLLMFSFFSCDFGIKENEETNSKEYFTVKGSCSIQGAIPSDLFPEKSIKQNAQRTVVPSIIKTDSLEITVNFVESNTNEKIPANVVNDDGVFKFEVELPAGKWTAQAEGKSKNNIIIQGKSEEFELSAEKTNANVAVILKPIQSENGQGTFTFSFGDTHDYTSISGLKYTYKKIGASVEPSETIDEFNNTITIDLSPGVYTFRFDFYSDMECKHKLLYSFTEVVNIFDGLTTDTWIGAGEYINDEGEICITDTMISQFVSTTVYVSEFGKDSNLGTFFEPVKTIQNAVDKVIAMNVDTASNEEKPYKIFLLSDIETSSNDFFESNNNALVNINPSSPLYLTISNYGDENATINAKNTGRVMYIGEKANVTLQNLILTGGYLADNNEPCDGAGLYIKNNATVKIKNCEISGNHAKNGGGLYLCPNANDDGGNFLELSNCTISGNTATSSGGGILFCPTHGSSDDMITTLNLINCTISSNTATQKGGGIYSYGKNPKVILDACNITNNSLGNESYNGNAFGGGLCIENGSVKMNGGSISGNTCISTGSSYGGGVYVNDGTFSMKGNAVVSSNDVYLKTGKTITISGELTFNGSVATITPENYAEDPAKKVTVLDAVGDITLSEQRIKFNVTQSDKFKTEITDEGCLKNTLTLGENAELTEDLYNICSTIKVSSAAGMKAISDLSQKKDEVDGKNFAGKTIILEDDIELESDYKLIKTFSGVFEGNNKTIKLNKPDDYDYFEYLGGAIFNKITGNDAEVRNLNVSGEAYIAGIAIDLENDAVISNCTNSANITSPNNAAVPGCGGIVGELSNGGVIKNCKNEGTITYNSTNDKGCGGIVGVIGSYDSTKGNSIIANCINNGEIIRVQIEDGVDQDASIGGICGEVEGNAAIYNCVNTGPVTSEVELTDPNDTENIGGITGYCSVSFYTSEFTSLPDDMGIFNCYNNGKISSTINSTNKYVGGIVGKGYVYTSTQLSFVHTIRVTNTVNNDETTFAFGITLDDSSTYFEIKNNFYKKNETSHYPSYESTFANDIDSAINTLNAYSDNSGRKYLKWGKGSKGNIVFSEEISDNQEITP